MKDVVLQNVVKRWKEVTDVPPQRMGPFTPLYKIITKRLKVMPWLPILLVSVCIVAGLYFLFGSTISSLVSILQRGF